MHEFLRAHSPYEIGATKVDPPHRGDEPVGCEVGVESRVLPGVGFQGDRRDEGHRVGRRISYQAQERDVALCDVEDFPVQPDGAIAGDVGVDRVVKCEVERGRSGGIVVARVEERGAQHVASAWRHRERVAALRLRLVEVAEGFRLGEGQECVVLDCADFAVSDVGRVGQPVDARRGVGVVGVAAAVDVEPSCTTQRRRPRVESCNQSLRQSYVAVLERTYKVMGGSDSELRRGCCVLCRTSSCYLSSSSNLHYPLATGG